MTRECPEEIEIPLKTKIPINNFKQELIEEMAEMAKRINQSNMQIVSLQNELNKFRNSEKALSEKLKSMQLYKKSVNQVKNKTVKKSRKGVRERKISKMLKKKLDIGSFNRFLIVGDKVNSSFCSKVFDVARKINKNSVLVLMDNMKKDNEEPGIPVKEAMENGNIIIITTKHSMEGTEAVKNSLIKGNKIFRLKRSLRAVPIVLPVNDLTTFV